MWRRAGQRLDLRMKQIAASQDAVGKIRMALTAYLPDDSYRAAVQEVEYTDGIVNIRTTSKALTAYLLMQTGPIRSALKAEGVRVVRIVVH